MSHIHEPADLINAVARNKANPGSFERPADEALAKLLPGALVKLGVTLPRQPSVPERGVPEGATGERFWVRVTSIAREGGKPVSLVGMIDVDMVFTPAHGMKADDLVRFGPQHILEIG